jgi:hypothetical protein
MRARLVRMVAATSIAAAAGIGLGTGPAAAAPLTEAFAAPGGAGSACTVAAPCSLATALSVAGPGATVLLAAGNYCTQSLPARSAAATFTSNITVRPVTGATVTMTALTLRQAHVTVTDITVNGTVYLVASANFNTLNRIQVNGAGTFVHSSDVTITNSTFQGGHSIDGLQLGDAHRVLVEGNTIRNFDQLGTSGLHADCLQIFDSSDITVRRNRLSNCHNSAVIFSGGSNKGINRVLLQSNFIQGCIVKTAACGGGNALDLRYTKAVDVTVVNNTMVSGTIRLDPLPGLVFDRNILGYLSQCNSPMTNTIIEQWNTGLCAQPTALGHNGNVSAQVSFVDAANGDLHLTAAAPARVTPATGTPVVLADQRDVDGAVMSGGYAGADEPTVATVPTAPPADADTTAPVVALSSPAATVSGIVTVVLTATDNRAVTKAGLYSGVTTLCTATSTGSPTWTCTFDSRRVVNGQYAVTAKGWDAAGNVGTSPQLLVRVAN